MCIYIYRCACVCVLGAGIESIEAAALLAKYGCPEVRIPCNTSYLYLTRLV